MSIGIAKEATEFSPLKQTGLFTLGDVCKKTGLSIQNLRTKISRLEILSNPNVEARSLPAPHGRKLIFNRNSFETIVEIINSTKESPVILPDGQKVPFRQPGELKLCLEKLLKELPTPISEDELLIAVYSSADELNRRKLPSLIGNLKSKISRFRWTIESSKEQINGKKITYYTPKKIDRTAKSPNVSPETKTDKPNDAVTKLPDEQQIFPSPAGEIQQVKEPATKLPEALPSTVVNREILTFKAGDEFITVPKSLFYTVADAAKAAGIDLKKNHDQIDEAALSDPSIHVYIERRRNSFEYKLSDILYARSPVYLPKEDFIRLVTKIISLKSERRKMFATYEKQEVKASEAQPAIPDHGDSLNKEELTIDIGDRTIFYPKKDSYALEDISAATGININKVNYYLPQARRGALYKERDTTLNFNETSFVKLILEIRKISLVFPDGEMIISTGPAQKELLKKFIETYENSYKKGWLSYTDFPGSTLRVFNGRISLARVLLENSHWKIIDNLLPGQTAQGKGKSYLSYRLEKNPPRKNNVNRLDEGKLNHLEIPAAPTLQDNEIGDKETPPPDDPRTLNARIITELPFNIREEREKGLRADIADLLPPYLENKTYSKEKPLDVYEFIEPLLAGYGLTFHILFKDKWFDKYDEDQDKRKRNKKMTKDIILKYLEEELVRRNEKKYGADRPQLRMENIRAKEIVSKVSEILSDKI